MHITKSKSYSISFDKDTGTLLSLASLNPDEEFVAQGGKMRPLFTLQFRRKSQEVIRLSALDAQEVCYSDEDQEDGTTIHLAFRKLMNLSVDVTND